MARPKKLVLDFLIWDVHFASDTKIMRIEKRHGNDGSMTFLKLLCKAAQCDGMTLDLSDVGDVEILADHCQLRDTHHLLSILADMVEVGLIDRQMWESERIFFSKALYDRYIGRLEKRCKDAERQNRKKEASSLQKRIQDVEAKESEIITRSKAIITQENNFSEREKPLIENTEAEEKVENENTEVNPHIEETQPDQKTCARDSSSVDSAQQVKAADPPLPRTRYESAAVRCDRQFAPIVRWRNDRSANGIKQEFVRFVAKFYYPEQVPSASGPVSDSRAKNWIVKREFDEKGIAELELAYEAFEDWRNGSTESVPSTSPDLKTAWAQQIEQLWKSGEDGHDFYKLPSGQFDQEKHKFYWEYVNATQPA